MVTNVSKSVNTTYKCSQWSAEAE